MLADTLPRVPENIRAARRHRLFAVLLLLAAALRAVVMLGYPPARLYWYDSFTYLESAVELEPSGAFHPVGYPLLLRALMPFHSVGLVAAVQHVMGLGTATLLYALLRRHRVSGPVAALAAAPMLFGEAFLRLEHAVLSDTLFITLVVAGLARLIWSPRLTTGAATAAGLLFAGAALTRTVALPLLLLVLLVLPLLGRRRPAWRPLAALAVAGLLPLGAYAAWYGQHHGRFSLTAADGVALWARTMTFADCRVIDPPPRLAPLCPSGPALDAASEYVWDAASPINRLPGGRYAHNAEAREFALRAIAAQPLAYLGDVLAGTAIAFAWPPEPHPDRTTPAYGFAHGTWPLPDQALVEEMRRAYDPDMAGMVSVRPYADLLVAYQYAAHLPGPVLAAILLTGAYGAVRRPGRVLLPWALAAGLLVAPVAVLDFDHRYALPAIPVACVAAALAVTRRQVASAAPHREDAHSGEVLMIGEKCGASPRLSQRWPRQPR